MGGNGRGIERACRGAGDDLKGIAGFTGQDVGDRAKYSDLIRGACASA